MSLPEILQRLGQSNNNPAVTTNPMLTGIRNLINNAKAVNNKDILMQQMANNPNMKRAIDYVKENGGDPKTACMNLLRQNGIDPNDITNLVGVK